MTSSRAFQPWGSLPGTGEHFGNIEEGVAIHPLQFKRLHVREEA